MKKLIIFCFTLIAIQSNAQVHGHALGIRGSGGHYGYGPEISYQLGLGDMNRLEMDLGWYHRGDWNNGKGWGSGYAYNLTAFSIIYHWDWNITDGLNWYIGPGAQLIFYDERNYNDRDGLYIGLGGQIGLEYDFTELGAPLLLGLDTRPMFIFTNSNGVGYGGALSLRYLFD